MTNSCALISLNAKKYITTEKDAIPPDFGKKKEEILLVVLYKRKPLLNAFLKYRFKMNYKGKMEFSEKGVDSKENYDTRVYRYAFYVEKFVKNELGPEGYGVNTARYYVLDRRWGLEYECRVTSAFYGQMIRAYAKQLEKVRLLRSEGEK